MEKSKYSAATILFIVTLMVCLVMSETNVTTDQASLLTLKAHISLDPSGIMLKNWSSSASVCDWIGVTCSSRNQRLIALDISGEIPQKLGNLENLVELGMGDNFLTGSIPISIFNISSLQYINIAQCNLSGTLPANICSSRTQLEEVCLHLNELIGPVPTRINECSALQILSLSYINFSGSIPLGLGNLSMLRKLYIGYNKLTENQLSGNMDRLILGYQLPNLEEIYLNHNNFYGGIPNSIVNSFELTILNHSFNNFTGPIPNFLGDLRFLEANDLLELNLSSNFLSGHLPREIGKLKVATLIDLSVNKFSGSIPTTIGDLQGLFNLSLAHNTLQGFIFESIGKLLNLERLVLNHNNLSSKIPNSLETLNYLPYFDVSFNDLSGEVPSSGPFKNFPSRFFLSNKGLCGDPVYGLPPFHTIGNGRHKGRKVMLGVVFALSGTIALIIVAIALACAVISYRRKNLGKSIIEFAPGTTLPRVSYYELMQLLKGIVKAIYLDLGVLARSIEELLIMEGMWQLRCSICNTKLHSRVLM
ncbi:probable LRR receptor-like serine threonine-kinase At3g47570 isoform X2 [Olea europaea subsp. europaea]|uniref:Probable LRR receptor-like serine threonine-kinase At3g47570 isoform X2 n=1 Tax=Olea europaea subsp. europaea TaxID=158383 RepID=A0A8S0SQY5_OLEEU|nr:probable LRR receptor-like serine threonine-kinase At3g47570 isoform X2 [Olea europaea subsp. europaea]